MTGIWLVSYLVLWVTVGALGLVMLALLRQIGVILQRVGPLGAMAEDSFGAGHLVPELQVTDLGTFEPRVLRGFEDRLLAVLFTTTTCSLCAEVTPAFAAVAADYVDRADSTIVVSAPAADAGRWALDHGLGRGACFRDRIVEDLAVPYTPLVALIDGAGVVRSAGLVNNGEQVDGLFAQAFADAEPHGATPDPDPMVSATVAAIRPLERSLR